MSKELQKKPNLEGKEAEFAIKQAEEAKKDTPSLIIELKIEINCGNSPMRNDEEMWLKQTITEEIESLGVKISSYKMRSIDG